MLFHAWFLLIFRMLDKKSNWTSVNKSLIGWHVLLSTLSDVEGAFVHLKVLCRGSLSLALAFNMSPKNKGKWGKKAFTQNLTFKLFFHGFASDNSVYAAVKSCSLPRLLVLYSKNLVQRDSWNRQWCHIIRALLVTYRRMAVGSWENSLPTTTNVSTRTSRCPLIAETQSLPPARKLNVNCNVWWTDLECCMSCDYLGCLTTDQVYIRQNWMDLSNMKAILFQPFITLLQLDWLLIRQI